MNQFNGFKKDGKIIKMPLQFFSEVLPEIDDLNELKVTLYCYAGIQLKEGNILYIREDEIISDNEFMKSLNPISDERHESLQHALERSVLRGSILKAQAPGKKRFSLYFANTQRSRAAIEGLDLGIWEPETDAAPLQIVVERPSIYTVYEKNIGPLTPLIAENIADLVDESSEDWVREAIEAAVKANVRKLAYIEAIINRWKQDGRSVDTSKQDDYKRFVSGKYGDEIEY